LEVSSISVDRLLRQQLFEQLAAALEPYLAKLLQGPHAGRGVERVLDQERPMFGAKESGRVEGFQRRALASYLQILSNGNERGHARIPWSEGSGDHGADVRHRHRLRRNVPGMPVILVPRVQDEAEIGCG